MDPRRKGPPPPEASRVDQGLPLFYSVTMRSPFSSVTARGSMLFTEI